MEIDPSLFKEAVVPGLKRGRPGPGGDDGAGSKLARVTTGAPGRTGGPGGRAAPASNQDDDAAPYLRQPEGDDDDNEGDGSGADDGTERRSRLSGNAAGKSEQDRVQEALDTLDGMDVPALDSAGLRRMLLKLERGVTKNQQLRVKYPDDPDKFMESEMDLDEDLKKLQMLATAPQLYQEFVSLNSVASVVGLLAHENADIAIDVVDLFKELTDSDNSPEDMSAVLVDALLEHQALELLVQNMQRLNETVAEEAQGVYNTLALFENLIELRPELGEAIGVKADFFGWANKRLRNRTFDQNKQYTSELLAIILQASTGSRVPFGAANGIDALLQSVAVYKRKDPSGADETELLENLFDALCSVLMEGENRSRFLEAEGVELMVILIKEKRMARFGALKTLSYAMNGVEGAAISSRFIEAVGLPTFFPAFMAKGVEKLKKQYKDFDEEAEEGVLADRSIVENKGLMVEHLRGLSRDRLLSKFVEGDFEKLDRLLELHFKYAQRVAHWERDVDRRRQLLIALRRTAIENTAQALMDDEDVDEDSVEDALYIQKLDEGLFRLQQVDLSVAFLCVSGLEEVRAHCVRMLHLKGSSIERVAAVLEDYGHHVGETAPDVIRDRQRAEIAELIDELLHPSEVPPPPDMPPPPPPPDSDEFPLPPPPTSALASAPPTADDMELA